MHRLQDLVRLHRMGVDVRSVARQLRMSPNTERKYRSAIELEGLLVGVPEEVPDLSVLKAAVLKHHPPVVGPQEVSSIDRWREAIEKLIDAGLEPRAIYDRLTQEHRDFTGSYWAVKRMCRSFHSKRGVQPEDVAIPVESEPGDIAQVDFGEIGKLVDSDTHVLRRAWVFVMVLAYSRHMFAKVVFDQKAETWLRLHVEAFEALGVPSTIVPDNLKAAVVRAAFGATEMPELNRSYRELARHYGFKIDPTPARAPKKKGKAESAVKYLKHNALAGRTGEEIGSVNAALARWINEVAGQRLHGTTHKRPLEVFETTEKPRMRPLPAKQFEAVIWRKATVHQDTHVAFERALYSVPWRWIGRDVWVRASGASITIFGEEERIASHSRAGPGRRSTIETHLPEGRRDLRHRNREYWEHRASDLGPDVLAYVVKVFDADDVLSQLRTVQAIVTHLERFPSERANAACRRATFFENYSYAGIKRILTDALDLQPLPTAAVLAPQGTFRFARTISELFDGAGGSA